VWDRLKRCALYPPPTTQTLCALFAHTNYHCYKVSEFMSFDERTDQMNWKDEFVWIGISGVSGLVQWLLFIYFEKFEDVSHITLLSLSILCFYILSILLRIQNYRGKFRTGKTAFPEKNLKWAFPVLGFLIGIALLVF